MNVILECFSCIITSIAVLYVYPALHKWLPPVVNVHWGHMHLLNVPQYTFYEGQSTEFKYTLLAQIQA